MRFTPKTEKELDEMNLWPAGEYAFEVADEVSIGSNHYATCDRVSKSGNDMIQLVLKVYNAEGQHRIVMDYLLESVAYKLRHAAAACGLLDKYEAGELVAQDFRGKSGFLELRIDKDKTGQYSDRNGVKDYVTPPDYVSSSAKKTEAKADPDPFSDSIPF